MKGVLVLMSTYNGEKYLRAQLDSILNQRKINVNILVRDDGSKDSTVSILEEYSAKYPNKLKILPEHNVGCRNSFMFLMKLAAKKYSNYDYYAFADQDDVWLPDKLYAGVLALDKEQNPIRLYYCHPTLVDSNLRPIKVTSNLSHAFNTLGEAFILQPCIGCAMIFSPLLLQKASLVDPALMYIHDAWTYKVCLVLGGKVIQDITSHILYRQHSSNTIGSSQSLITKFRRRYNWFREANRLISRQAKVLMDCYEKEIPDLEAENITQLITYTDSLKTKIRILCSRYFRSYKLSHNLMFKFAILFNRI